MKIDQEIDLLAPIDRVWAFFDDVPRVASCMPGARLSEVVDDKTFDGNVAIKVGPIGVNYQGRLLIEEKDEAAHTIRLKASGKDRKGSGSANAKIVATLTELDPGRTKLAVDSDVQLSGRLASLGRGVQDVAGKIFTEFGNRMSAEIAAGEAAAVPAAQAVGSGPTEAEEVQAAADASASTPAAEGAPGAVPAPPIAAAPPSVPAPSVPRPAPARAGEPIKVGALLWSILKDKLARLFRRRKVSQ